MGDWPRLVNLRRCARGVITDTGEATNTTLALTNNSLGAELIMIWQLGVFQNMGDQYQYSYQQQMALTPGGTVQAIVPGDAPPPGVFSSGDSAVVFTPDWSQAIATTSAPWPATFPFAVLLPAWSLVAQNIDGPTNPMGMQVFWEAILPQYFDRMYSHRFLELIIAQQGG